MGKTTVAAATAVRCAAEGSRTLVLSTDPAHSLSDAFGSPLGSRPSQIAPDLWGQELDATERMEDTWADIQSYLVEVLNWAGVDAIEAEELSILPGLDEVFSLADIRTFAETGDWDVIVVDCAPTAETIRFLSLPEILRWYMDRIFPAGRKVTRLVRPVLNRVTSLPVAGDSVFRATEAFYDRLDGVRELLSDPARSTIRLVVNPERMVIAEARRTATYLSLFGYSVDAVVANRLLPEEVSDPWFKAWKEAHAEHLAAIEEGFAPLPVLRLGLAPQEVVGLTDLADLAGELYGDLDPRSILHSAPPLEVVRDGDDRVLRLALPFADRDELEVGRRDGELLVRVGPLRRALVLPDSLTRRPVIGATMVDDWLEVRFAEEESA